MNKLRDYRESKKLTQDELGGVIGITGRAIGYYEKGQREPRLKIARKLAAYFDISIEDLFKKAE